MIDYRGRVVSSRRREGPFVNRFGWQIGELWYPFFNIFAVWVESLLLSPRVKYSEIGLSIASGRSCPLPVAVVDAGIIVDKSLSEGAFAPSPIDEQVFDEE